MGLDKRAHAIGRVAYLCLQATLQGQGSHAHVHEIIKGLKSRGLHVELFQPSYSIQEQAPGAFIRCLEFARVQCRLLRKLRRFDCLYIRGHFAALPAAMFARLIGIPVIQEINGPYDDLFRCWPWTRMAPQLFIRAIRKQYKIANAIISVDHKMGEWLEKESGNSNWHLVPNGADVDLFHPGALPEPGLSLPDEPYVVFCGAMAAWQGIPNLLEAANQPEWPNVRLVFIGDGPMRKQVELAEKANSRIRYFGKLQYRQVPAIVAKSIASISPQTPGGLRSVTGISPLKVYESMACGVPVIVTEIRGIAEVVRGARCGLVVPPDDSKAIASAVAFLFAHPDTRLELGQNGRDAAVREHSWDRRSQSTLEVLYQVASPRRTKALSIFATR